jgi:hypothetical protein
MTFELTDIIGYAASLIVLSSFVMKNMNTLRIVSSIGSALFVYYGIRLDFSIPIIFTNFAIICINAYYLLKGNK